ncbi:MAG TPA: HsdR family type I site-specific deoxyribonuclease [Bacteroidales bacterium]|nr:HsdR family type I site-specific deoxyribonuclease [Bacteroidales bacterium]HXK73336.1 HsdR family type I site-specific deoxyribonuclease [Bacteroidales bacterium]
MNTLTEFDIEQFAISLLEKLGYEYIYAPNIAPDSKTPERESFEQVLLLGRLQNAVKRINPSIPAGAQADAIKEIQRISSPELLANNETFHRLLTEGIPVTKRIDGIERGDLVWLIDFKNPYNNDFVVSNQFTVIENNHDKRPDIVLFVNGIPLAVMELKNPADENATIRSAFNQVETYKSVIPSLFTYNGVVVISDGLEAKAGSISAGFSRYIAWKTSDGKTEASHLVSELETLILGMLNKETLLDLIRHFIVFEKQKRENPETKITTITTVKKLAAYHQYYAVNRAVESTLRASYSPPLEGCQTQSDGVGLLTPEKWQTESDGMGLSHPEGLDGVVEDPGLYRNSQNYFSLPYNPKLKERARALRQAGNLSEVVFWNRVKNKQFKGYDFDRQKIIGNYIVDFYCTNCNVVIEIDGSSHDDKVEYDANRDAYLESLGLTVIHIPVADVMRSLDAVMEMLYEHPALQRSTHPVQQSWTPLQRRGIESSDLRTPLQETGIESSDLRTHLQGTEIESSDLRTPQRGTGIESSDLRTPRQRRGIAEESPESYGLPGVKRQPVGDRKGGVIWHTQGSGKSLSMVFYTGKIVLAMNNPTVVVITDRNDLDDQLFDTFAASKQLLRQDPVQAENRNHLKELLKVGSGGVVFTTIQKFQPEEGNVYELLSDRENIVVIADEAHRTQYGFKAKTIDDKDEQGDVVGKKIVYGFAKYMRDALPNATYLGFTGTPIENSDINTPAVFGNYVDIYDIAQAVEDGATVPIYYESRLAKVNLSEEGRKLVDEFDDELDQEDLTDTQKAKTKWTQLEALVGSENRINQIAKDIIEHFELRQTAFEGKAMIVAMSRRIAAELYEAIIKLRPEWHSDELTQGVIKVVMTSASSDGPKIAKHHTTKEQRRILADRMKNPDDELKLVIVRDMWLTGFDVPCMHTLYIDKPMKGHNLMQAIARVNRVYKDKPGGLIVDYLGIAADLKQALSFYSDAGGKGDPTILQEEAVQMMLEKLEVVSQMFKESPASERGGFNYKDYFSADTSKKLSIILAAEEHILGLEDGKKRYINEVTALSKAFAIAIPHDQAMDVKDEISFFQAVKARLAKFDSTGSGKTDEQLETTIRQVIDKALVTEKVIDIFDAAGLKKPDISILSEEFLLELKGMEHKNVALEVLKKILNDEIKLRAKRNLVRSQSLKEMLEEAIRKYHNKILSAAEVIEELIKLSKEIVNMDNEAKTMKLSDFEYAFYTAVANNESAKELMGKEKLRELAIVLTDSIRKNATIDWTIKESVKAKLRVTVKRLLRKYGYPPDMQKLATETVLKQAELIAEELTNK